MSNDRYGQEVIDILIASGLGPLEASTLLTRATVEMTAVVLRKSSGAKRQERYRERIASQTVTNEEKNQVQ